MQKTKAQAFMAQRNTLLRNPVLFAYCAVIALTFGAGFGVIRYWVGFLIIFQSVAAATLIPWVLARTPASRKAFSIHPGFKPALLFALMLTVMFVIGQVIGIGLAQPWFDPLGWLSRIFHGDSSEYLLGIAYTGSVARNVAMGVNEGFWVLLNILDLFFLFFFFLIMPWIFGEKYQKAIKQSDGAS